MAQGAINVTDSENRITDADPFVSRSAEALRQRIADIFAMSELQPPDQVQIEQSTEKVYCERFPAVTEWCSDDTLKLFYNKEVIEDLTRSYGGDSEVFGMIERVYMSGGICLGMLMRNINALDTEKIDLLYTSLKDISYLNSSIRCNDELSDLDKNNLHLALMRSDEGRLLTIGALRFVVGICGVIEQESASMKRLTKYACHDMTYSLGHYGKVLSLLRAFNASELENTLQAEEAFTERVSELTIALCYPMSIEEMRAVLTISTLKTVTEDFGYEGTLVVDSDMPEGFHIEGQ